MLTTITIKKKYVYFFIISIFLSIILNYILNNSLMTKVTPVIKCNESLKVNYKYKTYWLKNDKSRVHQFIANKISEQLSANLDKGNYDFDGEIISFNSNCEENIKNLNNSYQDIQNNVRKELLSFLNYLEENKIPTNQADALVFYNLASENVFVFSSFTPTFEDNTPAVKFLIILIFINLIFAAFVNIKIKLN